MQKWIAVGYLTSNPQKIETQEATICKFVLAVKENYKKDDKPVVSYHTIIAWNSIAENCLKYLNKGSLVSVVGKIQYRNWQDEKGDKKFATEIIAESVSFLSKKNEENA